MIWFYTGVPGSGKSYHAAKEIYKFIQKGKNIIGNMEINTDNIPTLNKKPKGCYLYVSNKEWLNNSILEMKIDRHGATRLKEPDDIYSYIQGLKGYAYNFHERDKQGKFKLHQFLTSVKSYIIVVLGIEKTALLGVPFIVCIENLVMMLYLYPKMTNVLINKYETF